MSSFPCRIAANFSHWLLRTTENRFVKWWFIIKLNSLNSKKGMFRFCKKLIVFNCVFSLSATNLCKKPSISAGFFDRIFLCFRYFIVFIKWHLFFTVKFIQTNVKNSPEYQLTLFAQLKRQMWHLYGANVTWQGLIVKCKQNKFSETNEWNLFA